MKRKRYSEEKIISILKEHESGASVPDLSRRHAIAENTIYRWKSKFGGMDANRFKYDVFISYRQLEPDKSVAARLHDLLETYRTPRALVRRGVDRRLGRVFRDSDELAATSNLSDSIRSAVQGSRFLVVVCSPRTPESRWVAEEIKIFRELGRGERILPLLIEGTPKDAFPTGLSPAIADQTEPLAADIRAASPAKSLHRLRREKLRIIAPLLGVDFAELEQREVRRLRVRASAAVGIAVAVILTVVGTWYQGQTSTHEMATLAESEARTARSTTLSDLARTHLNQDLALSLLLSVEANRSADTTQATRSLLQSLQRANGATAILNGHGNGVDVLAFRPAGDRLVSAARDGKLMVWDLQTYQVHRLVSENSAMPVTAIAYSGDSGTMVTGRSGGYGDAIVALRDGQSWNLISEHSLGFRGYVKGLALDQSETKLFTRAAGGLISLWDMPALTLLDEDSARGNFLLSNRSGRIISLLRSGAMSSWNGEGFEPVGALSRALAERGDENILSAALAPAGDRLALGLGACQLANQARDETSCVRIWSLATEEFIAGPMHEQGFPLKLLAFNRDGTLLAVAERGDRAVSVWDLDSTTARSVDIAYGEITSLAFSPLNDVLAVGSSSGAIELWHEPGNPALGRRVNQPTEVGWGAAMSPDGKVVAAGSRNSTIVLWALAERRQIHETFSGHEGDVQTIAFGRGSGHIVSVAKDGVIMLRDGATADPIGAPIETGTSSVAAVALSDDAKTIAWWDGSYEELNLLDLATGKGVRAELPKDSRLEAAHLEFSNHDRRIVIATGDCRLVEWDTQSQSLRALVDIQPPERCTCVAIDPARKIAAFGLRSGEIELWDAVSQRKLGTLLRGHRDPVRTLVFSPVRKELLSGDGADIVLWNLDKEFWLRRACDVANRNFSTAEWQTYFRGDPYRETCGPWGQFVPPKVIAPPVIDTRPTRPSETQ